MEEPMKVKPCRSLAFTIAVMLAVLVGFASRSASEQTQCIRAQVQLPGTRTPKIVWTNTCAVELNLNFCVSVEGGLVPYNGHPNILPNGGEAIYHLWLKDPDQEYLYRSNYVEAPHRAPMARCPAIAATDRNAEDERERQRLEEERERLAVEEERERLALEEERERLALEGQQRLEEDRQRQLELARQRRLEEKRRRLAEVQRERERQLEVARQRRLEQERQEEADRETIEALFNTAIGIMGGVIQQTNQRRRDKESAPTPTYTQPTFTPLPSPGSSPSGGAVYNQPGTHRETLPGR
ncbi:MAG: hypothetical protein OXF11_15415 [Deltaproteobacteria bacterium]|nr:hypothetical protein [Deltaproteobacteria bacterium]